MRVIVGIAGFLWVLSAPAAFAEPVEVDADAAAARLAEAIRWRTESQEGVALANAEAFAGLHRQIERQFPAVHRALEREVVGEASLLYTWGKGRGNPILLAAHLDVVPVESELWAQPPYDGVIEGGYIWGRGALDDKSSVFGILEAVERLVAGGFTPSRTVYLAFGHDEENDGLGAAAIAALLAERGERLAMVLDEGGFVLEGIIEDLDQPLATVGIAEKGFAKVELFSQGPGGHSSVPPPSTPVGRVARAAARLEENPMPTRLEKVTELQLAAFAPEMPFWQRLAMNNTWLFKGAVLRSLDSAPTTAATVRTTTAVTMLEAGVKGNVLPREARALVNFRILPGDSVRSVLEHVEKVVDDPEVTIRVVDEPTEPSPVSSVENEGYRAIEATIVEIFPDALVAPSLVLGMTDARRYQGIADGIYRFLPIRMDEVDVDRMHGTDERISVEGYADLIRFYIRLLQRLAD